MKNVTPLPILLIVLVALFSPEFLEGRAQGLNKSTASCDLSFASSQSLRRTPFEFVGVALPLRAQTATPASISRKAGEVVSEKASLTTAETGTVNFELGTLYVPENRSDPKSRIIGVGFARFRALKPTGGPPIFLLPGGPGYSFLMELKQSSKKLASNLREVVLYRRFADVVLVDQRGYSERGEILKFKYLDPGRPLDQPASLARATADYVEMARAAVAEFAQKGIDMRGYTIKECADDVNDLRQAIGYDRIILVGGSFGSQWSFAVMRRHPDIVARALVSGVEPLDYGIDMPSHVFAAVQRVWWEEDKDPQWQPYLPQGGLTTAAREVLRRLERAPVMIKVKNEKTSETVTISLGREDFQRDFIDTQEPAFLLSLYYEHYDKWARSVLRGRRAHEEEIALIGKLIDSSLGVTPRREYLLRTDPATDFLGQWQLAPTKAAADIWPSPNVGDEFRNEVLSQIPVVFVHGDWDTSTPVENTLNVAPYFPNGRVLIAVNGRHGVLEQIDKTFPKIMVALLEFLETGKTANLPARITLPIDRRDFDPIEFPPPAPKVQ